MLVSIIMITMMMMVIITIIVMIIIITTAKRMIITYCFVMDTQLLAMLIGPFTDKDEFKPKWPIASGSADTSAAWRAAKIPMKIISHAHYNLTETPKSL